MTKLRMTRAIGLGFCAAACRDDGRRQMPLPAGATLFKPRATIIALLKELN